MNGGQIGFYTAVATVIPVLILAYVIQGRALIAGLMSKAFSSEEPPTHADETVQGTPRTVRRAWLAAFKDSLWVDLGLVLVLAVFIAPVLGEYSALHALLRDAASNESAGFAWAGVAAAGGAVVLPSIYLAMAPYLPVLLGYDRPSGEDQEQRRNKN